MKKTICLVISNLVGGGAQRVVSTLSSGFSAYYQVYLVLHDGKKVEYPYEGRIVDLKTPVTDFLVIKVTNFIVRLFKLNRVKSKVKPFAVISFLESSNFLNLLSGRRGKTIISVRNYKSKQGRSFLGKIFHLLIKSLYKKSDLLVVPSKGIKADLKNAFKLQENKIAVLYNPYDLSFISGKATEPLDDNYNKYFAGPVLITVGSLTKQKCQWHLIRAFSKIRRSLPGMKLIILGEGSLRPYLEKLISDLQLADNVLLPGFKSNPFQFIARSSIFILPSLYEGFPNALVEAMACGVPVIASDCQSGPREILAPETPYLYQTKKIEFAQYGLLTPVGSGHLSSAGEPLSEAEKILSEAVVTVMNDRSIYEKYRHKSRERVMDFEISNIVKQWVHLLEA
jgi:glycosyltransferase involved in cell wall biosynthesis